MTPAEKGFSKGWSCSQRIWSEPHGINAEYRWRHFNRHVVVYPSRGGMGTEGKALINWLPV
jgi:hypothetical protein